MTHEVVIGNVVLPNPYILAPMAGVTDLPFRVLCAEMGAGMVCTEMISAKALSFKNRNTFSMLKTLPEEGIVSLQIFGNEPELMGEVAGMLEEYPFQILDINMGCPVPKVAGNGEGSALLKDPELAGRIMREVSKGTKKPVTAKIRTGFDKDHVNAVEVAQILEDNGAAALAVHGRTRDRFYSGKADWETIAKVKEAVRIPVIGNGDVTDVKSAEEIFRVTGCDAVMIGRAARGNPWIFRELTRSGHGAVPNSGSEAAFESEKEAGAESCKGAGKESSASSGKIAAGKPSWEEVREMILRHARMLCEEKGEYTGIREMRQHIGWYSSGFHGAASLRRQACSVDSLEQLEELLRG